MQDQPFFDAVARDVAPESSPSARLLLDPGLRIRGCNGAYERVSGRGRTELIGQRVFDAFPDNPEDSRRTAPAIFSGRWRLRCAAGSPTTCGCSADILDPARRGVYVAKVWSPNNSPVYDHGQLIGVLHQVEGITQLDATLTAMARAVEAGDTMPVVEQIHILAAFTAALPADPRRQQAWAVENEQLRQGLASRDLIGQAKGMIMERYRIDAVQAFEMLRQLSQQSGLKVVEVAQGGVSPRNARIFG